MARGNSRFPAQLWLYLVVTVAALCVVVTRAEVESPRVVNVAIYGAFTDINKTNNKREEYEPERYVSRVSGAVRAFKDINARDGTIIPDLAKPPTCNVYYQYHLVDSVSSFGTAIQQVCGIAEDIVVVCICCLLGLNERSCGLSQVVCCECGYSVNSSTKRLCISVVEEINILLV